MRHDGHRPTIPRRKIQVAFITRLSLRLGVVVLLGVVLLFGAGIFAATQVQQDLLPDISVPAVIAITPYPGASPEVVDEQVSVPVGNAMQGIAGADTVQSTSTQGASLVIVLFKDGTDIKSAEQDVNSALSKIRPLLPPQALSSTVQTFSTNSLPILEYAVSADEPLGDLSGQLRAQALPKLKGLAGVSSVVITGAPTDEVDVTLDPAKLAANRVTVSQVAAALQQASIVASIGSLKQGSATIPLQVSGSLTSIDQIGKITVIPPASVATGGKPAAPVRIDQLGTVQVVSVPADTITRTNGQPSIGLRIIKGNLETCKTTGGNKCTGDFGVAQRAYSAKDTTSGPVKLVKLYRCDSDPACAVSDQQSYPTGTSHTFVVAVGIGGTLRNATGTGDPIVSLRIKSNTGQSLDCDPGYPNLKTELQLGCRPTYVPNTGTPDCSTLGTSALWATNKPWSCIAVNTGRAVNEVPAGLNARLYNGDQSPNTCAPVDSKGHNNWHLFDPNYVPTGPSDPRGQDGFPVGDPRVLNAYITTYGAFSHVNGTSGSVPVIGFGHFYVTGYTGQGGGFKNPCEAASPSNYGGANPDDPVPNGDSGLIVGHFIRFVDSVGGDGSVACDPNSINACVIVMTR